MSEDIKDTETDNISNPDSTVVNDDDIANGGDAVRRQGSNMEGFFDSLVEGFSDDDSFESDGTELSQEEKSPLSDGISHRDDSPLSKTVEDIIVLYDAEAEKKTVSGEIDLESLISEPFPVDIPEENSGSETDNGDADEEDKEEEYEDEFDFENEIHTVEDIHPKSGFVKFLCAVFPVSGDSVGEVIRKIIFLCAVIVFVGAAGMLVSTLLQSKEAVETGEQNKKIIVTTAATTVNSDGIVETVTATPEEEIAHTFSVLEYYKSFNPEVVGFVELEGCDIYEPVVQTKDNEYYLTHTYYNGENKAGSIFMDYRCTVTEEHISPNIVLYGHNQQDGTMFGNLKYYKNDIEFYTENPIVKFNTEQGVGNYLIFAYFVTNTLEKKGGNDEVFHYQDYIETLNNPTTFGWYIYQVMTRSQVITPVDVTYGDQLLVLSTCSTEYSDSRFVVIARKLRDNESLDMFDFSQTVPNNGSKIIDWNAILAVTTKDTTPSTIRVVTSPVTTPSVTAYPTAITVTEPPATESVPAKISDLLEIPEINIFSNTENEAQAESETSVGSAARNRTTLPVTTSESERRTRRTVSETVSEETSAAEETTSARRRRTTETSAETTAETKRTRAVSPETTSAAETTERRRKTTAETAAETVPPAPQEQPAETTAPPSEETVTETASQSS